PWSGKATMPGRSESHWLLSALHCSVLAATRLRSVASVGASRIMRGRSLLLWVTMFTVALADLDVSCVLVAVTWNDPVAWPAVNRPAVVMVPPVAVQVTLVLTVPVTVAVNCCVPPANSAAVVGDTDTDTTAAATVMVAVADTDPPEFVAVNV